jgi:predicted RNA-binding protein associated with RNAse of E/G family
MITVYKLNQEGQTVTTYTGEPERYLEDGVVIRAVWTHGTLELGYTTFAPGDEFIEYYYRDRWYNIFEVRGSNGGGLKGWYCNITRPPRIEPDTIAWQDLWLDIWIDPGGQMRVLDEDEFALGTLNESERTACGRALDEIRAAVRHRLAPFHQIAMGDGTTAE